MNPERTLFSLVVIGMIATCFFYGDYWKKKQLPQLSGDGAETENHELARENERLREELAQARSLLSGAPYPIPEELITFVEKDLGLVFLKTPLAQLGTASDLRHASERNLELAYGKDGLGMMERTWELLGALPAGQNLQSLWVQSETTGARGIFDIEDSKIILAEDYRAGNPLDTGNLVRLLARQLLAQNFPKTSWAHEDEWNAWKATTQGAAINVQARFLRRKGTPKAINRQREDLLSQLPPAIQSLANFPYLEGHDYVQKHYLESRAALLGIFKETPRATYTIIRPDNPTPPRTPLPVRKEGQHGNRMGALGLRTLLDPLFGMDLANHFAREWRNDDYTYSDDQLIWYLKLSSPKIASDFLTEFQNSALPILKNNQLGREITIAAEGARITFTNRPHKK